MMKDKSLAILLMVLFGLTGITILTLGWLQPMTGVERGLTTFIGAIGLIVALSRIPVLKPPKVGTGPEALRVRVEAKDEI